MGNWTLFAAMLRNIRSRRMNRDRIGAVLEAEAPPITPEQIRAYAEATGDLRPEYEGRFGVAPPLFLSKLIFPLLREVICDRSLGINLLRMVHATQEIRWHRFIRAGESLKLRLRIAGIEETAAGELILLSGECLCGGQLAVEGVTGLIVRAGARPAQQRREPDEASAPPGEAFRLSLETAEGQQRAYAAASGDTNFIHTSEFLARRAGLPGTILHGACLMAVGCAALTDHVVCGDLSRLSGISGRFSRPVLPGRTLTLVGYEAEAGGAIPFEILDPSEKPVFRNGLFRYR